MTNDLLLATPTTVQPLPASAPTPRSGWRRVLWWLALVIVPLGVITHLIATYAVDVPYWDQWETARFFTTAKDGHASLLELARQQNESRLLFPNLVFLALSLSGTWSVVREMYFCVALVAVISAVLFALLRRTGFSPLAQSVLLFGINGMLFSLTQHENWFFGIQVCYYLPPAALCLAILANVSHRSLRWKTCVSLALSFVAAYSFSGGVFICLLAFPGLLFSNWSRSRRWLPTPEELNWHTAYVIGSVTMVIAYFTDYHSPEGEPPMWFLFRHPVEALKYLFTWYGSPLLCRGPLPETIAVGVLALLTLAGLLVLCRRSLANPDDQPKLYPWLVLAAYGVGTGLLTTLGRSGFGTPQALSSRYLAFSTYLYVAIFVLAAYWWCFHRAALSRRARQAVFAAGLAVLLSVTISFVWLEVYTMPWIRSAADQRRFAAQGLVFMPLMPSSQNLDALCSIPDLVRLRGPELVQGHKLTMPMVSATLRDRLQLVTPGGDPAFGVLDHPVLNGDGRVSIRGWAVDPYSKTPAGTVLITCTGVDKITRPLVVLLTNDYRPPKAPATGIYQRQPCAFLGLVRFDRLALGEYRVAAWRVDARLNILNQIGGTYLFDWERAGILTSQLDTLEFPSLNPQEVNHGGNLDGAALTPERRLAVRGWAVNGTGNGVPTRVLITCTNEAGARTQILGLVTPTDQRHDVARTLHNDALEYCGFSASFELGALPPGNYRIAAWTVEGPAGTAPTQLASVLPLVVPPK